MTSSPGFEDRAEHDVQPAGGAARDDHLLGGERHLLLLGQVLGQALARGGQSRVGHVAQGQGLIHRVGQTPERAADLGHRRQIGIAQREIADLVGPVFLLELDPGLEHPPNPGGVLEDVTDLCADHLHRTAFPTIGGMERKSQLPALLTRDYTATPRPRQMGRADAPAA